MFITRKEPNPSGAYPSPQTWRNNIPPEDYAIISDAVDMSEFYEHNGFVILTIEQVQIDTTTSVNDIGEEIVEPIYADVVTKYKPNIEVWEAWKASLPEPEPIVYEPTIEERVDILEEQLAQTDETAIELYEAQYAQEEINAAQDESLIYLYERIEMIGG